MFEIVLFQSYLFLSQIFRWANLVSEEERNETRITFCTDPLFFRTWLRMFARPPWRTTIKVMGSEYLEPDIPSHERFGAPSNLRATAFPPFLDCSRSLSFQTESRFNGWFDGRFFFFFFENFPAEGTGIFFSHSKAIFANIRAKNISSKWRDFACSSRFLISISIFEVMSHDTDWKRIL